MLNNTYQTVLFDVTPAHTKVSTQKRRAARMSAIYGTSHPHSSAQVFIQPPLPISPSVMVKEFNIAVGGFWSPSATINIPAELQDLRLKLIMEEAHELEDALAAQNLVAVADALGDLAYVTFGAALTFGIDLDEVIAEIHRSNMTKLGPDGRPILRDDGKVLKGSNYSPPCLEPIIYREAQSLVSARL